MYRKTDQKGKKVLEQIQDASEVVWKDLDQTFFSHEEDLNAYNLEFVRKNKKFF